MKKNKIILAVSAVMIMGAIAPVYYWHKKTQSRFPASSSVEVEHIEETGVKVYAIPESEEKIIISQLDNQEVSESPSKIELENGVVIYPIAQSSDKIEVTKLPMPDQIICQKDESKDLSAEVKTLIHDKEELLKELAELKKEAKPIAKKEAPQVDIMSQITSLMLSQQSQQMMMMQMMMQMMSSMQAPAQSSGLEGLFSPYGLSHDQYQSHARTNGHAPIYNFYNSTVTMGQPAQHSPSVLSQYGHAGGIGIGHAPQAPAYSPINSFESMGQIQNPMHNGFNFSQSFDSEIYRETASKLHPTMF